MRPTRLEDFIGQPHLFGKGKPLYDALRQGALHSMVLWGPPGCGKTTLGKLAQQYTQSAFISLSAVSANVKDIRTAVAKAHTLLHQQAQKTILFVDELHRFNKAVQDIFLPHIEEGTVTFIGATTENPSFELNSALLSRLKVYVLKPLSTSELTQLAEKCLQHPDGLGRLNLHVNAECRQILLDAADGDARKLMNLLEICAQIIEANNQPPQIDLPTIQAATSGTLRRFDKHGDAFYDQISALHKSIRGSSPDASLYWLSRMLDGGCDPIYIARRLVRIASEDIGNANLKALDLALNAWDAYQRLGSPEGELALAHATVYLACSPKSDAVYQAYKSANQDVKQHGSLEVPLHLRNAPTQLMKTLKYGRGYRHAHEETDAFAAGENYFPTALKDTTYYYPTERGSERALGSYLKQLRQKDREAEKNSKSADSPSEK
ncbi:MAG: replication-associated recombination protein A [Gammaproteobacteria bacterium]